MNKDIKEIVESYKSVDIPEINFETKIMSRIRQKDSKHTFKLRTALILCLALILTSTIVFDISKIIHNEDGSHTLIGDTEEKKWTIQAKDKKFYPGEQKNTTKLVAELSKLEIGEDEAKVGYYKYNEEYPGLFVIFVAQNSYQFNDETMDLLVENKDTPDYLYDVSAKLLEDFGISAIEYFYIVDADTRELIEAEYSEKSILGEIYTDIIPIERKFFSVNLNLLSRNMDELFDTKVYLSKEYFDFGMSNYEIDYETVMIDERLGMLSKRSGRRYALMTEVNGIGITIIADPRGNTDNMIELAKKLIEVLENY